MGDEELTGYITRSREKGRTKEQIIRALYSVGWKKEKVEAAFQKLDDNKNWQKGAASQTQPQQGKTNEPNSASQQQIQMLQQSGQQKQQPAPQQPATPAQQAQPLQQQQNSQQSPIQLQPLQKKSLFALPALFQKKQPPQPLETAQMAPEQKKPFSLPPIFGKKSEQPVSQAASTQPAAQQLPSSQQAVPQKSAQSEQRVIQSQAAKEQFRPPSFEGMKAAPGVFPPQTTFTIGSQHVSFGTAQPAANSSPPTRNPAFSNLASAAASAAGKKSFLPSVAIAMLLLFAVGYYFFQMRAPEIPAVDGPRIELNKTESKSANTTKPPVLQNTTKKPVTPPKNTTKTNVSSPTVKQNASTPVKNTPPAKNTTQPPTANSSTQPINQTGTQHFSSHSVFYSSDGDPPSKFCQGKNAALYRVHYFDFYGTGCLNGKDKEGYSFPLDFPYACDSIPCCYNDVSGSFSKKYDSFECGYYET